MGYSMEQPLEAFIHAMPKVELHVHLEGSIRPETLLHLAGRNEVALPADTVEGLRDWYRFTDFDHFIEIYRAICACIRRPADLELIAREFLLGQAAQNVRYSEVIFTPHTHRAHISYDEQLEALNRARDWARAALGVEMALTPDISRLERPVEHGVELARWAVANRERGIVGLGLGGPEVGNPPELFGAAFDVAREGGLASLPHAGETEGPASIWGALGRLGATRILHGVRCLEDPSLVEILRERQVPLDVCPTSNVCLGVAPSLAKHPLPRLVAAGLLVTINSDDPPMFNTTLTNEYLALARELGYDADAIEGFALNGVRAGLLPAASREALAAEFRAEFARLRAELTKDTRCLSDNGLRGTID